MHKKPISKSSKPTASSSKASSKAIKPKAASEKITQEQIAVRAYFISEQRQKTGQSGDHLSDWMEAERQLRG